MFSMLMSTHNTFFMEKYKKLFQNYHQINLNKSNKIPSSSASLLSRASCSCLSCIFFLYADVTNTSLSANSSPSSSRSFCTLRSARLSSSIFLLSLAFSNCSMYLGWNSRVKEIQTWLYTQRNHCGQNMQKFFLVCLTPARKMNKTYLKSFRVFSRPNKFFLTCPLALWISCRLWGVTFYDPILNAHVLTFTLARGHKMLIICLSKKDMPYRFQRKYQQYLGVCNFYSFL